MKCWICGVENATRNFEYSGMSSARNLSEKVTQREAFKDHEYFSNFEYNISARMFCQSCYDKHVKELQEKRDEYARLKKSLMFERAIRILEKQAVNIYEYKDIIDQMAEYVQEKPDNFDSAHEMVAAIILVDNAISAKPQYKIGSYRVDFYIPEYKTILEIDGETHKNNLYRDNQRDIRIREILGKDWETVRIGTGYIEKNARALVDAMIAIKDEKVRLRKKYGGELPDWYSKRNKAQRTKSIKTGDDHLFDI